LEKCELQSSKRHYLVNSFFILSMGVNLKESYASVNLL
jgi:hypothetical protein